MTSLRRQMDLHEASRVATTALEASSRSAIEQAFDDWDAGLLDKKTVRYRLEAVIRSAYRTSAAVARGVAVEASDIPGWDPAEVFSTEYLHDLLADVRRNLRDYKKYKLTRSQAIFRIGHSAGVAAQRGYTDQVVSSYKELEEFGFHIRKYWVADFVDNVPCPSCSRLHGTHVPITESFHAEVGESGVYRDLVGPPRHPNCKCRLFLFVASLDTAFQTPDFAAPQDSPQLLSTEDVKRMSPSVFSAVRASLAAIVKFLRRDHA